MALLRFSLLILFILLLLALALANHAPLSVHLWFTGLQLTMPLFIWALGVWLLGLLTGGLLVWLPKRAYRKRVQQQEQGLANAPPTARASVSVSDSRALVP